MMKIAFVAFYKKNFSNTLFMDKEKRLTLSHDADYSNLKVKHALLLQVKRECVHIIRFK